jgi:hypothetical protein
MRNLKTYEQFLNESKKSLNDYENSRNKILVGLKTNLLKDLLDRYDYEESGDMIHFFNKKGNHFATLFDRGSRYQELRHNGTVNDKGWFSEAVSGEVFNPKRNKPVVFDPKKHPELSDEFFDLIGTAYAEIGGHAKVKTPDDVFADPDWDWWEGTDLHGTPDFDLIMFGSKTKYGVKFSGVGHDGSREAKQAYLKSRAQDLVKPGYYIEVSGKLAEILISKYGCPTVEDQKDVEKVLGRKLDWKGKCPDDPNMPGNGWYVREIGGHPHAKILLGRPKV